MAEIVPFRGILYNPEKVPDIKEAIDLIMEDMLKAHNKIVLGL